MGYTLERLGADIDNAKPEYCIEFLCNTINGLIDRHARKNQ